MKSSTVFVILVAVGFAIASAFYFSGARCDCYTRSTVPAKTTEVRSVFICDKVCACRVGLFHRCPCRVCVCKPLPVEE